MSIYLLRLELKNLLPEYKINLKKIKTVASYYVDDTKKYLFFDDYTEEKLLQIVSTKHYTNVKINFYFWNIFYCDKSHIDMKDKKTLLEGIDTFIFDYSKGFLGSLLNLININLLLVNTFKVKSLEQYEQYIANINIDKKYTANYLIKENFKFPLTENYFHLIQRLFTEDNILPFMFNKVNKFDQDEILRLIEDNKFLDINQASYFIFNSNLKIEDKLLYTKVIIENYKKDININPITYLKLSNFIPHIGFYLYYSKIPSEYFNIYTEVMKLYYELNGSIKFIITDNDNLNQKMEKRFLSLKPIFDLKETFSNN